MIRLLLEVTAAAGLAGAAPCWMRVAMHEFVHPVLSHTAPKLPR